MAAAPSASMFQSAADVVIAQKLNNLLCASKNRRMIYTLLGGL
jgi:hypothetical protein